VNREAAHGEPRRAVFLTFCTFLWFGCPAQVEPYLLAHPGSLSIVRPVRRARSSDKAKTGPDSWELIGKWLCLLGERGETGCKTSKLVRCAEAQLALESLIEQPVTERRLIFWQVCLMNMSN
jgi:hypothetical protein